MIRRRFSRRGGDESSGVADKGSGKWPRPFLKLNVPEGNPIKHSKSIYAAALVLAPHICIGQLALNSPPAVAGSAAVTLSTDGAGMTKAVLNPPSEKALTERWLDMQTLSHTQRYRNSSTNGGEHTFLDGQQRSVVEGKLKLDAQGHYGIAFRASSGRYFNWAFADYAGHGFTYNLAASGKFPKMYTPAEAAFRLQAKAADPDGAVELKAGASAGWEFYMRELYFSATPIKAVTVEVGSFGIERGLSTEITTFDDDGYITGQRVRIRDSKHLFFDEVGYTNAFFGHVTSTNLFDRGADYKLQNYHQLFVNKRINSFVAVSGEYTSQNTSNTFRQAILLKTSKSKVIDHVRLELYERPGTTYLQGLPFAGASGFAVTMDKKITDRLAGDFGFAKIDQQYGLYNGHAVFAAQGWALNGDSYGMGTRAFVHASYQVNPVITAFGFYTHCIGPRDMTFTQQGLNAGLQFNLKTLINSGKKVL